MLLWKGLKGLKDVLSAFIKLRKHSTSAIDAYLNDSAFTAVKRNAKFLMSNVKGVPFAIDGIGKGYLFG